MSTTHVYRVNGMTCGHCVGAVTREVSALEPVTDVRVEWNSDHTKLQIDPPRTGWQRGERYVMLVRGGAQGVKGMAGERVECDAAFYFLRQTQALDTPDHEHAFPGNTHDERVENAHKLEVIREDLADAFDFVESKRDIPRTDVAALWAFTVTKHTELAMDQPSQRIPLPIDLLIDPATGHIDAPAAPWDSPTEAEAVTICNCRCDSSACATHSTVEPTSK